MPEQGSPTAEDQYLQGSLPQAKQDDVVPKADRKWTLFLGPSCLLGIHTQPQLPALSSAAGLEKILNPQPRGSPTKPRTQQKSCRSVSDTSAKALRPGV